MGAPAQAKSTDVIRAVLAEADRARARRQRTTDAKDSGTSRQTKARSANAILKDLASKEADHLLDREEEDSP